MFIELVLNSLSSDSPLTEGSEQFAPRPSLVSHDLITPMFYNTRRCLTCNFPRSALSPKNCTSGRWFMLTGGRTAFFLLFPRSTPLGYDGVDARERFSTGATLSQTTQPAVFITLRQKHFIKIRLQRIWLRWWYIDNWVAFSRSVTLSAVWKMQNTQRLIRWRLTAIAKYTVMILFQSGISFCRAQTRLQ